MIRSDLPPAEPSTSPSLIFRVVLLVINILFGFIGFFFFIFHLGFRHASSCLMLGVVCAFFLHLTYCVMKGKLNESYNFRRFKIIFIISIVVGVIELISSIIYVVLGVVLSLSKQDFHPVYGFYAAAIPSFMACLWAFLLAYECKSYMGKFGEFDMGAAPQ